MNAEFKRLARRDKKAFLSDQCKAMLMHAKSFQSCPNLCDPMDSSPPGSFVHRTAQARILEWGAISFSRAKQ